ncbi:glycosyltransferase [Pseudonocardia sp. KRD-291]|nr:glycosyltransferase [Pseudonocardia sp. KRD291]
MRILLWHVHGSWTGSFVQGRHTYLLPTLPEGGPWGRGRCGRDWPASVREVPAGDLGGADVDVVLLQRPEELELAHRWLGRRPGVDVPAIYVEHNTPHEHPVRTRHPMAGHPEVGLVHVTHFNDLMWDNGDRPSTVVSHGIPDPGHRYTGELPRAAALINEPIRRGRVTGTDLLDRIALAAPVDVYGIGADELGAAHEGVCGVGDLGQARLHPEMARRRVYVHTARWTSLGLSLIEAMALGMPVVAVASTEAVAAVPPAAGVLSTDVAELVEGVRRFVRDPEHAASAGAAARAHALTQHGQAAFLRRWDELLDEAVGPRRTVLTTRLPPRTGGAPLTRTTIEETS